MGGLEPFSPDDDYCVYCHAPAAGMCAGCGALCCGECVELVMGWTTQQAVCRQCAAAARQPAAEGSGALPWIAGLAILTAVLYFLAG